jgi:hypothetical protein
MRFTSTSPGRASNTSPPETETTPRTACLGGSSHHTLPRGLACPSAESVLTRKARRLGKGRHLVAVDVTPAGRAIILTIRSAFRIYLGRNALGRSDRVTVALLEWNVGRGG